MNREWKNRRIANAYYNQGLALARQRDLTGAAAALKKSLRFDKFQTDARNLLGLIYLEIGEAGAALCQWVISLNLQEQDNLAEEYLQRVQGAWKQQIRRQKSTIRRWCMRRMKMRIWQFCF